MSTKENVYGEGNYEASRKYNEDTKKFVDSGRVEETARNAAPKTPAEASAMRRAEQAALLKAKGEKKEFPVKEPDAKPQPVGNPARGPVDPDDNEAGTPPRPGRGPDRR